MDSLTSRRLRLPGRQRDRFWLTVGLCALAAALFFLWRLRREVPALDVRKHDEKKKGLPLKKKYIPYYISCITLCKVFLFLFFFSFTKSYPVSPVFYLK